VEIVKHGAGAGMRDTLPADLPGTFAISRIVATPQAQWY